MRACAALTRHRSRSTELARRLQRRRSRMVRIRFTFVLAIAALVPAGCSGAHHAGAPTPTTRAFASTSKTAPPQPCPSTDANPDLARVNASVKGAREKLVPFAATKIWSCRWRSRQRLNDGGYMASVDRFEDDTNRLPRSSNRPVRRAHPRDKLIASQPIYFTFANDSQEITLRLDAYGDLTNGFVSVQPSCGWEANFLAVDCAAP
jgi:hypothetical protein